MQTNYCANISPKGLTSEWLNRPGLTAYRRKSTADTEKNWISPRQKLSSSRRFRWFCTCQLNLHALYCWLFKIKKDSQYLAIWKKLHNFASLLGKSPWGFQSHDSLAQLVEHNTFNVGVLGSSPRRITIRFIKSKKTSENQRFSEVLLFASYPKSAQYTAISGQRIFPVGGREYQEYSVIFAQWNQINCSEPSYPKSW